MSQEPATFNFDSADLEAYLRDVNGLTVMFRMKMLSALASEENEMGKVGEIFADINNLEVDEGIQHMTPAFRQGFLTLFIMNGGKIEQLSK